MGFFCTMHINAITKYMLALYLMPFLKPVLINSSLFTEIYRSYGAKQCQSQSFRFTCMLIVMETFVHNSDPAPLAR
ncbi:hypothetical protein D3C85_1576970 [compost metagenome]